MKDLVSLMEEGDKCGYCQEFWHKCRCLEKMGDDIWGDDYHDYREEAPPSAWRYLTRWW